jgi:dihydrofolate reductase
MGKIIISENVSLDGVVQDPAGDEDFSRGGWVGQIAAREDVAKVALDEALGAEAFLLGRRSYEWLAARWPSRNGALADRLNSLPKYVVSSTLEDPHWNNSTVLKGDPVDEVAKLKETLSGEIVVAGSFQLLGTLIEHDLVDELRLKVFPVVLGAGGRLFGETSDKKPTRLIDSRTLGGGIAYLTYELVHAAEGMPNIQASLRSTALRNARDDRSGCSFGYPSPGGDMNSELAADAELIVRDGANATRRPQPSPAGVSLRRSPVIDRPRPSHSRAAASRGRRPGPGRP